MSRAVAALLVAASFAGITTFASTVAAQDEADPSEVEPPFVSSGTVELELIDQTFDLARSGTIELTYRITGDLETVADLVPPTTTTTTTTTSTTTTTTTTLPPSTVPSDDADADQAPPTPTVTTTTEPAPTTTLPPPVPVSVGIINYEPLDDPTDLTGLIGPNPRANRFPESRQIDGVGFLDARSMIEVERADVAILRLAIETDVDPSVAERLRFEDDGIHPILVQLSVNGQLVARHGTVVERRSSDAAVPPPIDLSLIASIDDPGPTSDDDDMDDAVAQLDALLGVARVVDAPLTLDIPPSVARSADASGRLDADAASILEGEDVLAAPATPFDVSSAVAVDRVDAFVNQLNAGEAEIRELLGVIVVRDVWLATEPLSADGARVLRDLGFRYLAMPIGVYTATVADDAIDAVDALPARDRFVELELPDGSTISVLLVDDEFGATFESLRTDEILAAQSPMEWTIETVAGWRLAQYAAPRVERQDRLSRLVAAPGLGAFDPTLVIALEEFAATTESIRFTKASVLASVTDTQARADDAALPETAGPSLEERLDRIALVQADLDDTSSMLADDGDERLAQWSLQLDSFVSTAFADDAVFEQLDELSAEAARIRAGVIPPEPFTFTLTGREETPIELSVGNSLDEPLRVRVRLSSPRLSFPAGDLDVTLAADDTTTIDVPVIARSNGTSAVTVEILTPDAGRPLIEPVRLTSRVNALTGLGQVLTAGFVLMLASWWLSSWLSKRRARATEDAEKSHPASGTDDPPAE